MRFGTSIPPCVLLLVLPFGLAGQARVTRIVASDGSAVETAAEAKVTSLDSFEAVPVKLNMLLGPGAEVQSPGGEVVVLTCTDGATVTVAAGFKATIWDEGTSCLVDVRLGTALMQTNSPSGLSSGEVVAGAQRTEYALRVRPTPTGIQRSLEVFDGAVRLRSGQSEEMVEAGNGALVERARSSKQPIEQGHYTSMAGFLARLDVSVLRPDARAAALPELTSAHFAVLRQPDDMPLRLNLVAMQLRREVASQSTRYQVERVLRAPVRTSELETARQAVAVAAFRQLGDEKRASKLLDALRARDGQEVQNALVTYRIDPVVIQKAGRFEARPGTAVTDLSRGAVLERTLLVRASAEPPVVSPGLATRILVTVADRAGRPVMGATVRISAGGGSFHTGGSAAAGATDAKGVFVVGWSCKSCAPAYALDVEASKEGWATARTRATVKVKSVP